MTVRCVVHSTRTFSPAAAISYTDKFARQNLLTVIEILYKLLLPMKLTENGYEKWEKCHYHIKYEDTDLVIPMVAMTPFCRCLLYTSPSPRDRTRSRMPSSA